MGNLIFQVNIKPQNDLRISGTKNFFINDELFAYSNQRAKKYSEQVGADYMCLTESKMGDHIAPVYHKLYIYELFKLGYERIFLIDSDAIFTSICPNIFELWQGLCAVREHKNFTDSNIKIGVQADWPYFMSGQMMLDRDFYLKTKDYWERVFEEQIDNPHCKHDQGIFNILVSRYVGYYTDMGKEWGSWEVTGRYIRHYACGKKKRWLKSEYEQWESEIESIDKN